MAVDEAKPDSNQHFFSTAGLRAAVRRAGPAVLNELPAFVASALAVSGNGVGPSKI